MPEGDDIAVLLKPDAPVLLLALAFYLGFYETGQSKETYESVAGTDLAQSDAASVEGCGGQAGEGKQTKRLHSF